MLSFADSGWDILSNTTIFFVGIWIAIAQKKILQIKLSYSLVLYAWHTSFCLFYFYYSLHNIADSTLYYTHSLTHDSGFMFGTKGIRFFTSFFSSFLNLSYGGVFLVYNLFGYIGMIALYSALQTIINTSRGAKHPLVLAFILLPGLSFWSSAIGKDALTFMGSGLAVWSVLNISARYPAFIFSVLVFLVARPHMAAILLFSVLFSLVFSSHIGAIKKVLLLMPLLPLSVIGIFFALQYVGLENASGVSDIVEYVEDRQGYNLNGGSSVDIAGMSVPLRLFTYLFRPLVFDANGILGFIISIENIVLLCIISSSLVCFLNRRQTTLSQFSLLLFLSFSIISWIVLSNTTANLGIAIRQKWMFAPMLFAISFSYMAGKKR